MENNKLPRICYILGGEDTPLEVGEEFQVQGFGKNLYHINDDGIMKWGGQTSEDAIWEVLNYPEKIIRQPPFTDDEKALMRLYVGAGYPWFARDKNEDVGVWVWKYKPKKDQYDDFDGRDGYPLPKNILDSITFANSPFNAAEYLEGLKK